jgi:hypothetical protein
VEKSLYNYAVCPLKVNVKCKIMGRYQKRAKEIKEKSETWRGSS